MKNVLKQTISALIIFFGIFTYEELSDKQNIDEETIELINDEESVEQITQSQNSLAREYIEKNFEVLIRRQEEKLGIVYSARPKISFDCEDGSIYPNNLPEISYNLKINYELFKFILGISDNQEVAPLKPKEMLMLSLNTTITVGIVEKIKGNEVELSLNIPVVPIIGENVGMARNINGHWRLIGFGEVMSEGKN